MEGSVIRTVAKAVLAAWQARGPEPTIDTRQVLARVGEAATPDEVSEALGYLGFRSCIEARSTPGLDGEQVITILMVDTGCLGHYVGD
jgi:hypothetical protein